MKKEIKTKFNVGDVVNIILDDNKKGKGVVWSANYSMLEDPYQNFYWVQITEGVKHPQHYEKIPLLESKLIEMDLKCRENN